MRQVGLGPAAVVGNGELLTTSHDGYVQRFGLIHRRVLMISPDGTRLDGEKCAIFSTTANRSTN